MDAASLGTPPVVISVQARYSAYHGPLPGPGGSAIPVGKVHRLLRAEILAHPTSQETVFVVFRDPLISKRDSIRRIVGDPGRPNRLTGAALADTFQSMRSIYYRPLMDTLASRYQATTIARYWLIHALLVRMPLALVDSLAKNPEVLRIDPLWGEGPPQGGGCGNEKTFLDSARALLGSDPLLSAGHGGGRIALLDSGVNSKETLLPPVSADGVLNRFCDCITDSGLCRETTSQSDAWQPTLHGTLSAVALSGTASQGDAYHGMTHAQLDSYQVYGQHGSLRVYVPGAVAAFQDAIAQSHTLIVAEIADGYSGDPDIQSFGELTAEANWAFILNAVVIAANGNTAGQGIPYPANAPQAIGVGRYCILSPGNFEAGSAWGRTADQRIKPDVGGPTSVCVYTPSTSPPNHVYDGTSGATPFVGGAALLLWNRLRANTNNAVAPGQVYAGLVMCGQNGMVDATSGAGRIKLPEGGLLFSGIVPLDSGLVTVVDLNTANVPVSGVEAAIWWPEYGQANGGFPAPEERAEIGLEIEDPSNHTRDSNVAGSAYQRASLSAASPAVATHPWKLKIFGAWSDPHGPRDVYFAAWAKP